MLHWQPVNFNLFKSLRKDDTLDAFLTADGNKFHVSHEGIYYYMKFVIEKSTFLLISNSKRAYNNVQEKCHVTCFWPITAHDYYHSNSLYYV